MATPKVPSPKQPCLTRNYDVLIRRAEEQSVRAYAMVKATRKMCDLAAEMRRRPTSYDVPTEGF